MASNAIVLYKPPTSPQVFGADGIGQNTALIRQDPAPATTSDQKDETPSPAVVETRRPRAEEPESDEETLEWMDPRTILPCPWQTRLVIEDAAVGALANSLLSEGMHHPPLVRINADGFPEIVIGDIRRLAAIVVGLSRIRVRLRRSMSDVEAASAAAADVFPAQGRTMWEKAQSMAKLICAMVAAGEETTYRDIQARSHVALGLTWTLAKIAMNIDAALLQQAGADVHDVNKLGKAALEAVAKAPPGLRARVLRQKLGWAPPEKEPPVFELAATRGGGPKLVIRKRIDALSQAEAKRIINKFSPSWTALRARARGD